MPGFLREALVVAGVVLVALLGFVVLGLLFAASTALPAVLIPLWIVLGALTFGATFAGINFIVGFSE